MSEHAFDPIPDEQAEPFVYTLPALHATVTADQLTDAIATGVWQHADASTELWLNTAFIPAGRDADALAADLSAHGIDVTE